jgi:putative DNA methylase
MNHPIKSPKKLIEVALPLDAINVAAAREKSIRHGHPSTLHLWWARRPLAAARAVIFAQLVNDPGYQQGGGFKYGKNKKEAAVERKRLFGILEELVKWENTTNEEVLETARAEIRRSWREVCELNKDHPQAAELFNPDKIPGLHDPFAGGGTIPLEAQRLGLEAFASDLNPVAVLINKAMIEIPPKFAGRPPVHPKAERRAPGIGAWKGAEGLAEDVRRYGAWMREEAEKRIGHLYPKVEITAAMAEQRPDLAGLVGQKLTVIAWLWARTVKSPNPAFSHVDVPLVSSFVLSSKEGKQSYVEPVVKGDKYHFEVRTGKPPESAKNGTKLGRGANFRCVLSNAAIEPAHIYAEANAGRMGARLMAIVAEGDRSRIYLPPTEEMELVATQAHPEWKPEIKMPENPRWFSPPLYGLTTYGDLFTPRQLVALTTFSDLVTEARELAHQHAHAAGLPDDPKGIDQGGTGAKAYGDAVSALMAFALSRSADRGSTVCSWDSSPKMEALRNTFGRQAIPMVWDFAEGNPFSDSSGNWTNNVEWAAKAVDLFPSSGRGGTVFHGDAQSQSTSLARFVSTDPPYYDNIGYADLSDFFYVWLRRSLKSTFPDLFATVAVPKAEELVATPYRHGTKDNAEAFFLDGMTQAMHRLAEQAHPAAPVTIYYAFKQSETKDDKGTSNTGWETFLEAVLRAGFALTGTWPMRTELSNRMVGSGNNALASSIIMVCRKRLAEAATISRREFLRELNLVLPEALDEMTKGSGDDRSPVAPVDLSQAIIGPGMAVFSKYAAVLEADGSPMKVKTALQLINRFLAEDDFDHDTQFCLHWFDQNGWGEGAYGEADVLARAKATSVAGLVDAGVVKGGSGKVRLLRPNEYPSDWDPKKDNRTPIWEALHQLIRTLREKGESGAGEILAAIRPKSEAIRQLAYRLYTLCERRGQADDARAYNELVTTWSAIETASGQFPESNEQLKLFGGSS